MTMLQDTEAVCCKSCGRPFEHDVGGVVVSTNTVTIDGEKRRLTPKLCEMLRLFLRSPGVTIHHERIRFALYQHSAVDEKILAVMICDLRRRLADTRLKIISDYGAGYRLELTA